jgi:glutamate/aspartate transport system permease protein
MSWDWQFYCNDTATGEAVAGCFGPGGKEQTYLQWMLGAWGWTLSISLLALLLALVVGSLVGIARTAPNKWLARFGEAWTELFRNIPLLVQVVLRAAGVLPGAEERRAEDRTGGFRSGLLHQRADR